MENRVKYIKIGKIICLLFISSVAFGQIYTTESAHAEVHGSIPVAPNYSGVSDKLEGTINLDRSMIDFRLPLESLHTGNHKRDKHMNKALESSSFPFATFSGELKGFDQTNDSEQQVSVAGNFTIHGQSKYMEIPGTLQKTQEGLKFHASFPVYLSNFGIERPGLFSVNVNDKHAVEVAGIANEETQIETKAN